MGGCRYGDNDYNLVQTREYQGRLYHFFDPLFFICRTFRQSMEIMVMALETLKNIKKIGDFSLVVMDKLREQYPEKFNESGAMDYTWFEKEIRPHNFVYLRHDVNSVSFTIQNGPIKENGVNGCQVDTLIETAKLMLIGLNAKFPCIENEKAIDYLQRALAELSERKRNRTERGVEGLSLA